MQAEPLQTHNMNLTFTAKPLTSTMYKKKQPIRPESVGQSQGGSHSQSDFWNLFKVQLSSAGHTL